MKKTSKDKRGGIKLFFNTVGWYGAIATLTAYMLISFGVLKPLDLRYQILNLSGAIGLGLICYYKRTYQPLFVNIVWSFIAILALINILYFVTS